MQEIADKELPRSMAYEWTELAYLQLQAGNTAMYVFALAVVFVFLVLAAQYESWTLPLAVILVVPMCLLCSVVGVQLAGMEVNIFTQIGFVVLVGLASKNAILIVEFAKQRQEAGVPRREATLEACRLRLRPILMTSFAFIFGVVPLVIAEGAGAEMRRSLGMAVFSGMLGVTLFGIFLTPVFYYVIQGSARRGPRPRARQRRRRRRNSPVHGVRVASEHRLRYLDALAQWSDNRWDSVGGFLRSTDQPESGRDGSSGGRGDYRILDGLEHSPTVHHCY